jgi:hypothetical protein
MKTSIRTRFTLGMIFLFVIILVLSVFSGYYLNRLSNKTSAILRENYLSVVYAREMSDGITIINQQINTCFLSDSKPDSVKVLEKLDLITMSLQSEKKNITEPGEEKLVSDIETGFYEYQESVLKIIRSPRRTDLLISLQELSGDLFKQLLILSQMNGKALEAKTDDAKASSKSALTQMTVLATLCFLIGMTFTFSFASYFNQRFFQLYSGIKEIVSSNYDQRLFFDGKDEFHEISLLLNEMAENLKKNKEKMSVTLRDDLIKDINSNELEDFKKMLFYIKYIEEHISAIVSKFEKK